MDVAEVFAVVGSAVEARREREQLEWVLGLTGGEMERDPLHYFEETARGMVDGKPTEYPIGEEVSHAYWYDGIPEWAGDDFDDSDESNVHYMTLIYVSCIYRDMPEMIYVDREWWIRV